MYIIRALSILALSLSLSSLTQADIVFILQATSVPDRLLLLLLLFNTLLLDPAQMKIGSTGLEDI